MTTPIAAPITPAALALARSTYPYLVAYIDDPEIGSILQRAAAKGWDEATLLGALYPTQWWQNHQASQRTFDAQMATDPASANAKIAAEQATLDQEAARLGITTADTALLARQAVTFAWNPAQISAALRASINFSSANSQPGAIHTSATDIASLARDYMIPLADADAQKWAAAIATGSLTIGDIKAQFQTMSQAAHPELAAGMGMGLTPGQLYSPYRQLAAKTLELTTGADGVDLMNDPKYTAMLSHYDPTTKTTRAMTLNEAGQYLRGLPEYRTTQGAAQQVAQTTSILAQRMGFNG